MQGVGRADDLLYFKCLADAVPSECLQKNPPFSDTEKAGFFLPPNVLDRLTLLELNDARGDEDQQFIVGGVFVLRFE